ncbi:hypothetical protein Tsubulata_001552 [Turnera subulata]|uniref:CCHC-type domain-containing protein n=1 Tax=Turnera subulata TaxID=218843 RepID=A0A9Q0F860_9ROSI|nr:hypothetical protein Tsubulata_001552 [Turnera subulata]
MLSAKIGKPIRIDINTLQAELGKFARLAIEVEFSKPLLGWVENEDRWFKVIYEDIPDFCFGCGKVGHIKEHCPGSMGNGSMQDAPTDIVMQGGVAEKIPGTDESHASVRVTQQVPPQVPPQVPSVDGGARYGPWMKVARQPRQSARRGETRVAAAGGAGTSGSKRAGNPFELGSASALLHEVHRDASAPSLFVPRAQTIPLVFQTKESTPAGSGVGKKKDKGEPLAKNVNKEVQINKQGAATVNLPGKATEVGAVEVDVELIAKTFTYPRGANAHARTVAAQSVSESDSVEEMVLGEEDRSVLASKRKFVPPLVTLRPDGLIMKAGIPKQQKKANALLEEEALPPDPSLPSDQVAKTIDVVDTPSEPEEMAIETGSSSL